MKQTGHLRFYPPVILRHFRTPVGFEKRPTAYHTIEAYNPLCGDKFSLFLDIERDLVTEVTFYGYGCAVSTASASILVKRTRGKSLDEIQIMLKNFLQAIENGRDENSIADEEVAALAEARHYPGRSDCASLAWKALDIWLAGHKKTREAVASRVGDVS